MNKLSRFLLTFLIAILGTNTPVSGNPTNQCVSFYLGQGTGCSWMCNYCASSLGTNNYYFTDNVCTYESGIGCVGNPVAGKSYTCCSSSQELEENEVFRPPSRSDGERSDAEEEIEVEDLFLNEWN